MQLTCTCLTICMSGKEGARLVLVCIGRILPQPSALRIFPLKTNNHYKTETGETINQIKMTIDGKGKEARRRGVAAVYTGRGECVHSFYDPIVQRRVRKYLSLLS